LKNDILCDGCASKVGDLGIKIDEIIAFRKLNKIGNKYKILKEVSVERVLDTPKMFLIITDKENASKIIGRNGGMIKKLGEDLGKPIRVINDINNVENFVKNVFYLNPIIGVNVLYGEKELYKIRFPKSEKDQLLLDQEKFLNFFRSVFGSEAQIVFE